MCSYFTACVISTQRASHVVLLAVCRFVDLIRRKQTRRPLILITLRNNDQGKHGDHAFGCKIADRKHDQGKFEVFEAVKYLRFQ